MVKCAVCDKEIPEDEAVHCVHCGAALCKECGILAICPSCAELWEAEIDLEDMEAEH